MLLRLTMLPWPRAAIPGAIAATRKNGARTLLANILSNAATSNSAVGAKSAIPALLIRMSMSPDRKSTRLNSSHGSISYAVFCLKKKKKKKTQETHTREHHTKQKNKE